MSIFKIIADLLKNRKNRISTYFKIKFIYPLNYTKVGTLNVVVPPVFFNACYNHVCEGVEIYNWSLLKEVGDYNYFGKDAIFDNCSTIGSFCSISANVKIGLRNHNLTSISTSPYFYEKQKGWVEEDQFEKKRPVVIQSDVLISANAIILEGVELGVGSVIAAGAVVVKDVPPYAIVGGVPAKVLKYRFDEGVINKLLESKWWERNTEELLKQKNYFNDPSKFLEAL